MQPQIRPVDRARDRGPDFRQSHGQRHPLMASSLWLVVPCSVATGGIQPSQSGDVMMENSLCEPPAWRIAHSVLSCSLLAYTAKVGRLSKPSSGPGERGSWVKLLVLRRSRTPWPSLAVFLRPRGSCPHHQLPRGVQWRTSTWRSGGLTPWAYAALCRHHSLGKMAGALTGKLVALFELDLRLPGCSGRVL